MHITGGIISLVIECDEILCTQSCRKLLNTELYTQLFGTLKLHISHVACAQEVSVMSA